MNRVKVFCSFAPLVPMTPVRADLADLGLLHCFKGISRYIIGIIYVSSLKRCKQSLTSTEFPQSHILYVHVSHFNKIPTRRFASYYMINANSFANLEDRFSIIDFFPARFSILVIWKLRWGLSNIRKQKHNLRLSLCVIYI